MHTHKHKPKPEILEMPKFEQHITHSTCTHKHVHKHKQKPEILDAPAFDRTTHLHTQYIHTLTHRRACTKTKQT